MELGVVKNGVNINKYIYNVAVFQKVDRIHIGITCLELQRGQEIVRKKEIKNVEKRIVNICEKKHK